MSVFEWSIIDLDTGAVVRSGWSPNLLGANNQPVTENQALISGKYPVGHVFFGDELPARAIPANEVKQFARRLIGDTSWYLERAQEPEGKPVPQWVWDYRRAVRERCEEIEVMNPIPADYRDAKYWPDRL